MKTHTLFIKLFITTIIALSAAQTTAEEIRIAVASNFNNAITNITEQFEANTGHKVLLSFASTGKHYAQIINGAPFDIFFAADIKHPQRLEQEAVAIAGSRFTYAVGKLILWSPMSNYIDSQGKVLEQNRFRHLAIANPKLAPYGKAAQEVLQARGLWEALKSKMVRGENIGQTFQFIKSGNAELGFVAYSQIKRPGHAITGSWWHVPQTLYTPIEQQAVLLKDNSAAKAFLSYVKSDDSLEIIRSFGYGSSHVN